MFARVFGHLVWSMLRCMSGRIASLCHAGHDDFHKFVHDFQAEMLCKKIACDQLAHTCDPNLGISAAKSPAEKRSAQVRFLALWHMPVSSGTMSGSASEHVMFVHGEMTSSKPHILSGR